MGQRQITLHTQISETAALIGAELVTRQMVRIDVMVDGIRRDRIDLDPATLNDPAALEELEERIDVAYMRPSDDALRGIVDMANRRGWEVTRHG